ncbi:L-seryl-tRNA(Sec) selenium transferase [Microbispora rosea subsp. aerata]|nr:L-seryl-tRNA(Sec) selenium transferase [Microbispora rosea]GGO15866.1 L-seryl-tRNA(Sec) selenium transferase [Microbispora rosea subsp. aerata]GIH55794.1 L-seryl-tRNA(Sec) selenium transferase [Microbispora rosea subsp. aerata]GLJ83293.1 L-seryl-tRNA(Sec) selenium transferase [Microbispora rosea subsp. aerata]
MPRTDAVLADPRLVAAAERLGRPVVKDAVARAQQRVRQGEIEPEDVAEAALAGLPRHATSLRPVLNMTGVLLHTNLGRAPLSPAAVEAVTAAAGATDVEFDLDTGARARRGRGAVEALAATALAAGREIVISKGELVEIGDGFRIPDLLVSTGARLREVGTTNRTTPADYRDAIGPGTGFVLKVHPSNFRIEGFTGVVEVAELTGLGVPVVVDIGSGLLDRDPLLPAEPDATSVLRAGADLVTASGDKLLGGPQAGLLLGRRDLVERLRRHPLARALRVDKLTLAALEATLRGPEPPVRRALHADPITLGERAEALAEALRQAGVDAAAVPAEATVGGGGALGVRLPSAAVSLPERLAAPLRRGEPPVVGRVEGGRLLLDLRAVPPERDGEVLDAVRKATGKAVRKATG